MRRVDGVLGFESMAANDPLDLERLKTRHNRELELARRDKAAIDVGASIIAHRRIQ